MYAIIVTGGKQVKVSVGDTIYVEKLSANEGETVVFDKVLLVGGESSKVGLLMLKALALKELLPRTARVQRLLSLSTRPRLTIVVPKVIDNHTQELQSNSIDC